FFFFQAEAGIRVFHVTGVQTCALPICLPLGVPTNDCPGRATVFSVASASSPPNTVARPGQSLIGTPSGRPSLASASPIRFSQPRSEERRVGKAATTPREQATAKNDTAR